MDANEEQEIFNVDDVRKGFYAFLASIYKLELTDAQIQTMASHRYPVDDPELGSGYALIAEYLRHRDSGTREELAVDYAHVFLGAGEYEKRMAPPYESVYTSEDHLLIQESRDGVLVHYRAENLDLPADNTTPEDHISFEFQFMGKLIERADEALREGDSRRYEQLCVRQKSFFREHLQNWVGSFCSDIEDTCNTDFYRGIAEVTSGFMRFENDILDQLRPAA